MLRMLVSLLAVTVLLSLVAVPRAAEGDLKAILVRAIKVHGGEEALTKYQAARAKNKGKISVQGMEIDFTQEVAYMLPDKLKESLEMEIQNQKVNLVTLVNGDKVSIEANGQEVPISDPIKKALEDARLVMKLGRLVSLLKNKDVELAPLGEIKVEDKPAVGVLAKIKGKKDFNLYFSKETGLLVKVEYRTVEATTGKEITEERIIQEYNQKSKERIAVPKKILVKRDGANFLESEVVEMQFFEKIDDSEFKK
jgi:hypothetical protein